MKNKLCFLTMLLCGVMLLSSCRDDKLTFRIGISQCAGGEWRSMQNEEMLVESTFYDGVKLEFRNAKDNDSVQISDIQHFIDQKVDMLIISPNTLHALVPIIKKAYDAGIPVLLFDRRIEADCYTAFVGANNRHIGELAATYLAGKLEGHGNVVELLYNQNSAPFRERHEGFLKAIKKYPDIRVYSVLVGYTDQHTQHIVDSLVNNRVPMQAVFAEIDLGLRPTYEALKLYGLEKQVLTVGIDGMPFSDMGLDRVLNHQQTATFVYPSGGDRIIQVAMDILQHKPFKRETELSSYVIDQYNARSSRLQQNLVMDQNKKIGRLHRQADKYFDQVARGKLYLAGVAFIVFLLSILVFVLYRAYWLRNKFNEQLLRQNKLISSQKNEMREQRDRLLELTQQLEEATQTKLVFFTNISHDFRTPLTLITGPLSQLKEYSHWDGAQLRLYDIIQKNVGILMRLVNQIIDFRKYENGKMSLSLTKHNLADLLQGWSQAFYALAEEKHISFQLSINSDSSLTMNLDEEKVERVFYNLVYNAFKFTPSGGSINVALDVVNVNDMAQVQLKVCDTGVGMSAAQIHNIFDRFYKVDSHDTGSGIGLNLAKAFIELHGGNIQVESELQHGTSFIVSLPMNLSANTLQTNIHLETVAVSDADASLINELELEIRNNDNDLEVAPLDEGSKEMVLVIDDNSDIREYVAYLLGDKYKVIRSQDGQLGLEAAQKFIPDVIICDVMMPVMDGLDFCRRVKDNLYTSHIPVLLLTACSLDEQRVMGYESGADAYISKPFTAELLLSRVRNLIENRKCFKPNTLSLKVQTNDIKDLDEVFVRKFKKLLEEHLCDSNLSIDWLGEQLTMSRVQLYRKVKALLGTTPSNLIREGRMKKAETLLHMPGITVVQVAYEVGFTSQSYFTKCYKEFFGKLPTKDKG